MRQRSYKQTIFSLVQVDVTRCRYRLDRLLIAITALSVQLATARQSARVHRAYRELALARLERDQWLNRQICVVAGDAGTMMFELPRPRRWSWRRRGGKLRAPRNNARPGHAYRLDSLAHTGIHENRLHRQHHRPALTTTAKRNGGHTRGHEAHHPEVLQGGEVDTAPQPEGQQVLPC